MTIHGRSAHLVEEGFAGIVASGPLTSSVDNVASSNPAIFARTTICDGFVSIIWLPTIFAIEPIGFVVDDANPAIVCDAGAHVDAVTRLQAVYLFGLNVGGQPY